MNKQNKSQVWVETAIYSLIGLTIIAILLAAVMPQIDKMKDKAIVTQTMTYFNSLDNKISEIQQAPANIRIVPFKLVKGNLEIDSANNKIIYIMKDTNLELSEANEPDILEDEKTIVREGNIILKTEKYRRNFAVFLILDYSETLDLTFKGEEVMKTIQPGTTDYKIKIENPGDNPLDEKIHIDIDIL